jgi:hypothetical protein
VLATAFKRWNNFFKAEFTIGQNGCVRDTVPKRMIHR